MVFIQMVFELLGYVPMPWQFLVFFFVAIWLVVLSARILVWTLYYTVGILQWLTEKLIAIVLFPEYLLTTFLRKTNLSQLLVVSYAYTGLFEATGSFFYFLFARIKNIGDREIGFPNALFWLTLIFLVGIWYLRPELDGTMVAEYFDKSVVLWNVFYIKVMNM